MKCKLEKASDTDWSAVVEVETMEDLRLLAKQHGRDLIVSFNESEPHITIYDDYVE